MKGIYTLIINVKKDFKKRVGSLGVIEFKNGIYLYTGSGAGAFISIEDRLKRHLRRDKRKFWHIDYLLSGEAFATAAVASKSRKESECLINNLLAQYFNGEFLKSFGSSDCKCKAHLIKVNDEKNINKIIESVAWVYKQAKLNPYRLIFK
ncbi:MAG: GIY-YIG nuclease family protein [Candidatus Bathyarchaeia archaeon]